MPILSNFSWFDHPPQYAVSSSPLLPHTSWAQIASSSSCSQTLKSLCSSLSVKYQVSHLYKKTKQNYSSICFNLDIFRHI
jgi:hypothetical protein